MSKETLTSTFTDLRKNFLRLAMRFLPNREDADDALQEAFFRLWKHADRIDSREEAEALTVATVKNLCIDVLRKKEHLPTVELDEHRDESVTDSADEILEKEERFRAVERIIAQRLTPLQQQILRMKEYEGRKYNEIADILGTYATVEGEKGNQRMLFKTDGTMKKYERTIPQWKELARRYFEAETTEAEEDALVRFLATPAAQGKEFDELRAVMGYAATGRVLYGRRRTRGMRLRYYAAAAVAGLIVLTTAWRLTESANVCVAYINGQRCTDKEVVLSEALKSIEKVSHRSSEETVQSQLSDIFHTLEEGGAESVDKK